MLRKLAEIEAEIYYSPFSILEALWVASRNVKNSTFDIERFSHGLRSIVESGRYLRLKESGEVYREALRLYTLGHEDMIDNILYTSSVHFGIRFLTLDRTLMDFVEEKGLEKTFIRSHDLS
jgi:predicted nucleic-acid-binding protein